MLSSQIKNLLEGLDQSQEISALDEERTPPISINKLTGKIGAFYEKMRYLVDIKEEHTIRRSAIGRMIKRKLTIEQTDNIGLSLLEELVRGGYLPNNKISEGTANAIQEIINKYILLGKESGVRNGKMVNLAATEIEQFLYPQFVNDLITECFYQTISEHIRYIGKVDPDELDRQIYIGCRRSLLEDDHESLFYALILRYIPELPKISRDKVRKIAPHLWETIQAIKKDMENPLGWRISSRLKNHAIYFSIIKDIVEKYGVMSEAILKDPSKIEEHAKKLLNEKYKTQHHLVSKSGVRAVIYIFVTKIALAIALELPYEKIFLQSIDYFAIGVNVIFHPLLLFLIAKTVPSPTPENTNRIIAGAKSAVRNEDVDPLYIKPPISNIAAKFVLTSLYVVLFLTSFGLILWLLKSINFNIVSIALFLFFLTLVSYFGFRLRLKAKRWKLSVESDNILSLLWNFLAIPIVRTGRWLTRRFSSINIFVFVMDFIIEIPFKLILGTFDSFVSFLKEKIEDER
ncbi:MAG: hypothetical protein ABH889_03050 [Candidatus Portnoybacteria bacterium]